MKGSWLECVMCEDTDHQHVTLVTTLRLAGSRVDMTVESSPNGNDDGNIQIDSVAHAPFV